MNFPPNTLPDRIALKRLSIVPFKDYRMICISNPLTCKWAGYIQRKQRPSNWIAIKFPMKPTQMQSLEKSEECWLSLCVQGEQPHRMLQPKVIRSQKIPLPSTDHRPAVNRRMKPPSIRCPGLGRCRAVDTPINAANCPNSIKVEPISDIFTASAQLYGRRKWKWPLTADTIISWWHAALPVFLENSGRKISEINTKITWPAFHLFFICNKTAKVSTLNRINSMNFCD